MRLTWDQVSERFYETGVDHGVLYLPDNGGAYDSGFAWNGLVTVTESPSGAEANPQYADNIKYLNLISTEMFGGTIEAFTYPDEFAQCDGTAVPSPGVAVGQQSRRTFGLAYRTQVGNDVDGVDYGYKLHLIYGAMAAPSEKAYASINDSPEAITFSWALTTTPVDVPGNNPVTGKPYKPTATLTIDSTKVDAAGLAALNDALFGTEGADPRLPLPAEVLAMFGGAITVVATTPPTYNAATDIITIPATAGVEYLVDGAVVPAGPFGPIAEDTVVTARPAAGYAFTDTSDTDWTINFA
jgi:hypothetical protein